MILIIAFLSLSIIICQNTTNTSVNPSLPNFSDPTIDPDTMLLYIYNAFGAGISTDYDNYFMNNCTDS